MARVQCKVVGVDYLLTILGFSAYGAELIRFEPLYHALSMEQVIAL